MRLALSLLALVLVASAAACGDDDDSGEDAVTPPTGGATATPAAGGEGGEVNVELVDFSVIADPSAGSGQMTFTIENTGPNHMHEFVVIKTDLDAASLPTAADGSVDEEAAGLEVIDEVEEIAVGGSGTLAVALDPGHYALVCNVVHEEEGETFVHYDLGMRMDFTVE